MNLYIVIIRRGKKKQAIYAVHTDSQAVAEAAVLSKNEGWRLDKSFVDPEPAGKAILLHRGVVA